MTEQEAINRISYLKNKADIALSTTKSNCSWAKEDVAGTIKALDMAIEALEMISKRDELEDFNTLENYIAEWNKYKVFHSDEPTEELHWMHALIRYYMVQYKLYKDSELSPKEVLEMKTAHEQYRALGTVEEILKVLDNHKKVVATQHETLKEYRNLGTVEELRVAKEMYDAINKTENDLFRLGMGCDDFKERVKAMARQMKGKV